MAKKKIEKAPVQEALRETLIECIRPAQVKEWCGLEGDFHEYTLMSQDGCKITLNNKALKKLPRGALSFMLIMFKPIEIWATWQYPEEKEEIHFFLEDSGVWMKRPCMEAVLIKENE